MKRTKSLSTTEIKTLESDELAAAAGGGGANAIVIGSRLGAGGGFPHGILIDPEILHGIDLGPVLGGPLTHGIPAPKLGGGF